MTRGEKTVERARALVGTRFVAQGRDPAVGLDCVGLMIEVHRLDAKRIPDDYRLGGDHRAAVMALSSARFRRVPRTKMRAGDMLLLRPGAAQWHLGLWTGDSLIHADVASRRAVERPGAPTWPIAAVLRPRLRFAKGI